MKNKIAKILKHDWMLHFFGGFMIFIVASIFLTDIWSLGVVLFLAVLNEVNDARVGKDRNKFSLMDIYFTILPAVLIIIESTL